MFRKVVITLLVFAFVGMCVFGIGLLASPAVGVPQVIEPESACPVTSCASGICHGYDDVPDPDGVHEMICPEAGCASLECHAWKALTGRYRQASDASLNLWVLFPVLLISGLILFVKKSKAA